MTYTQYTHPLRVRPGRPYGVVRANRAEQLVAVVAQHPGLTAAQLAALAGVREDYGTKALVALHVRGLARSEWRRVSVQQGQRECRVWFPTPLALDLLTGRDHPGTLLGQIRATLAERPHTVRELAAVVSLPLDALRTVLRVMVLQGDCRRVRHMAGERYALPLDTWDEAEECAA